MPRRAVLALLAWLAAAGPARAATLGEALRAHGVDAPAAALAGSDQAIAGYDILVAADEVIVAYYRDAGRGVLAPPLVVGRLDRRDGQWRTARLGADALRRDRADCTGSVVEIRATPSAYYLGTHLNPSAGCTLILSRTLQPRGLLDGWILGVFRDGRVVYQRSQVHFAPVHPLEIALHRPGAARSTTIHPARPYGPLRQAHVALLRRVWSDPAWCARQNHPCDPERFDERLVGPIALDERTGALAFITALDNTAAWSEADRWRLEAFRELRTAAAVPAPPPETLAAALLAALARVRRLGGQAAVIAAFEDDPGLQALLRAAEAAETATGETAWARLERADPGWARPEAWDRLLQATTTPPETTDVAYVYRPAARGGPMEFRELPRSELDARCGGPDASACLRPGVLARLFSR